jgi:UDP-N-acetylglucosamine--N-acetylmuramyl-(pentapeptide) pyrophosphoryl-undecaprenol N-acetylglucosamine transferase
MNSDAHRRLTIVFAGGGTGGHLFPALAVADEVRKRRPDAHVLFIGTSEKIEAKVVPASGYGFQTIWISGFRRRLSVSLFLFPVKLLVSLIQSRGILKRERPGVVVGTGGYVCGPPVYMASRMGIPTIIQEQNSYPGVTTRLLAGRADTVFLTFDQSKEYLAGAKNLRVAGNPVRSSVGTISREQGAAMFGLNPSMPTLLVFGGSLGAASINAGLLAIVRELAAKELQIIWQTGKTGSGDILESVRALAIGHRVKVMPFIDRMEYAFGASDLAVCRSGATTLAELALAGLPAILVPYPFAAADHQTRNAMAVVEAGGAELCRDREIGTHLHRLITELVSDPERRARMAGCMKSMAKPDAAAEIATEVLRLAGA